MSSDFPAFNIDSNIFLPHFFEWITRTEAFVDLCRRASEGSTNRVRLKEDKFLQMAIPLPSLQTQKDFLERLDVLADLQVEGGASQADLSALIQSILHSVFNGKATAA